jgi:hypothetical protein
MVDYMKNPNKIQVTKEDLDAFKSKKGKLLLILYNEESKSVKYKDTIAEILYKAEQVITYNSLGTVNFMVEDNQQISRQIFRGPQKFYILDVLDVKDTGESAVEVEASAKLYDIKEAKVKGLITPVTLNIELGYKKNSGVYPVCCSK